MLTLAIALAVTGFQGAPPAEVEAMKKLDFIIGKWEGSGKMLGGPGEGQGYVGGETIQKKLQGRAVLIEGHFIDPKTKQTVHETLAVVTYDAAKKKYNFDTYLFNQPNGHYDLEVMAKGFKWHLEPGGGVKVEFTMTLDSAGNWHEIGEADIPGRGKMKMMDMTLKRMR